MKKRNLYILVFIICIFGLALVQYRYLQIGLNLAKVQFNEKMERAIVDIKNGLRDQNQLTYLMVSAMSRDTSFFRTSPDSILDASSYFLNDFIAENLSKNGIEAKFNYNLQSRDSTYYLNSPNRLEDNSTENVLAYPMLVEGYLPDVFEQRFVLKLTFDNISRYYLSQLNGLTVPSLLFLLGIVLVVLWALRTYYWQRNIITTTDEFINNLTHELKTPVFSIRLASKMLEENVSGAEKPYLQIIKQQVERLSAHIEKVLQLASLQQKQSLFILEEVDFYPALLKVCEDFNNLGDLEKVDFNFELADGPYLLQAEPFHMENAVLNILDNAKKYANNPKVQLLAKKTDGHLSISIQDNGIGIPEDKQKRIFEKYYRINNGNLHDVKGFGLGLNYVRTVLKKHKGTIEIDSKPDEGTTVTLKIPLYE